MEYTASREGTPCQKEYNVSRKATPHQVSIYFVLLYDYLCGMCLRDIHMSCVKFEVLTVEY